MSANRARLMAEVEGEPGIHLRELERRLDLSLSTVRHHAASLVSEGRIEIHRFGRLECMFPRGYPNRSRDLIIVMRQSSSKAILEQILQERSATNLRIHQSTGLAKSTVSLRLGSLLAFGVLRKVGKSSYEIGDEALDLIMTHGELGFRRAVDRYVDLWRF